MRFFLTGITGFIAPHLKRKLEEMGHKVYCAERSESGTVQHCRSCSDFDYIIHLAAHTSISKEFNPNLFESNVVYAKEIFKSHARILYASSTSAYELNNPYAYTKKYNEWLGEQHGNALGLRLFNVYGPGNNKGIVKKTIECCLSGDPLTLYGGNQVRDFLHVDDVVRMIIANLDNREKFIDIGTGKGTRIIDLVNMIQSLMHTQIEVIHKDAADGEQEISIANPNIQELDDCIPLADGLIKTIESYLKTK